MEEKLSRMNCEACEEGAPQVADEESAGYQKQIPDWVIIENNGVRRLERVFKFKNFVDALAFTNSVGAIAEEEGHHPAILLEWGRVGVAWWTHTIGGLHRNDFIMAARTDHVFEEAK